MKLALMALAVIPRERGVMKPDYKPKGNTALWPYYWIYITRDISKIQPEKA
jgi:hypothetical protein